MGQDDAELPSKLAEDPANGLAPEWMTVRHAEQRSVLGQRSVSGSTRLEVLGEHGAKSWTERDEPALTELGFSDHQESALPIDVADPEPTHLAHAKPERVEHREDRPEGRSPQLSAVGVGELASECEQSRDLLGPEDDGCPAAGRASWSSVDRRSIQDTASDQPLEEDAKRPEERVEATGPSTWPRTEKGIDEIRADSAGRANRVCGEVTVEHPQRRFLDEVPATESALMR